MVRDLWEENLMITATCQCGDPSCEGICNSGCCGMGDCKGCKSGTGVRDPQEGVKTQRVPVEITYRVISVSELVSHDGDDDGA